MKVSRERRLGEAQETPGTSFWGSLPTESHGDTLNSPNNVETGATRSQPGTVPRATVARVFTGAQSRKPAAPTQPQRKHRHLPEITLSG